MVGMSIDSWTNGLVKGTTMQKRLGLKRIGMALAMVTLVGCGGTTSSEAGPRHQGLYGNHGYGGQQNHGDNSNRGWHQGPRVYGHHAPVRSTHRVERRQENQAGRIEHGVHGGALTRHETRKLWGQQRQINRLERNFSRDGHISKKERRILEKKQDRASRAIHRFKHNDRNGGYGGSHRGRHDSGRGRGHGRGGDAFRFKYGDLEVKARTRR